MLSTSSVAVARGGDDEYTIANLNDGGSWRAVGVARAGRRESALYRLSPHSAKRNVSGVAGWKLGVQCQTYLFQSIERQARRHYRVCARGEWKTVPLHLASDRAAG